MTHDEAHAHLIDAEVECLQASLEHDQDLYAIDLGHYRAALEEEEGAS